MASSDYLNKDADYIDILRRAEKRGIDVIAFTDHNTVKGYATMMENIDRLQFLEQSGRAQADELRLLAEYRRLLDKVLVLPGFEFTATFGFHILGIFSPDTPVRYIEHILMSLNVPFDVLERGDAAAGSTDDVLSAYQMIDEGGGLCIAAHGQKTKTSMRTAFVAVSYKQREMMADVLDCIESQLSSHHYDPMVFVRQYGFASNATDAMGI